ncbi:hypothetical protein [Bacillus paranthracis]|uniref:hypothetical protein n=1 Tax=Bacillus paranthracis TaxID=2026186 RepID=UPI00240D7265|nr:hypothetical protein [Bacillus paranthracis]
MLEKINFFENCMNELAKISTEQEYSENSDSIVVSFTGTFGDFQHFVKSYWEPYGTIDEHIKILVTYDHRFLNPTMMNSKMAYDVHKIVTLKLSFSKSDIIYAHYKDTLVFLNLNSFTKFINETKLMDFLKELDNKKFIFLPIDKGYENGIIHLLPLKDIEFFTTFDKNIPLDIKEKLDESSSLYFKYMNRIHSDFIANPYVFHFSNVENTTLKQTLDYNLFLSTMHFISNWSSKKKFIINGYKNVELTNQEFFCTKYANDLFNIFEFVYDKDKFVDKAEIARNIFSLYLNDEDKLDQVDLQLPKIYDTITTHFKTYIQKEIKEFFDQRKDVEKEAYNAAIEAKSETDKVVQSINLLLLGLITAALTGVFAYSKGEKLIFLLALLFHIIYITLTYFINNKNFSYKEADILASFNGYIKQFSVLTTEETNKIKKTYIEPAFIRLKNALLWYKWLVILLVLLLICVTCIGFYLLYTSPEKTSQKDNTMKVDKIIIQQQDTNIERVPAKPVFQEQLPLFDINKILQK